MEIVFTKITVSLDFFQNNNKKCPLYIKKKAITNNTHDFVRKILNMTDFDQKMI